MFRPQGSSPTALFAGLALLAPTVAYGASPSFDCKQASNEIEKMICADAKLSALDVRMAELYSDAIRQANGSMKTELLSEQRGWIKNRNGCATRVEPKRNCVLEHYTQRNSRLEEWLAVRSEPKTAGANRTTSQRKHSRPTDYDDDSQSLGTKP